MHKIKIILEYKKNVQNEQAMLQENRHFGSNISSRNGSTISCLSFLSNTKKFPIRSI